MSVSLSAPPGKCLAGELGRPSAGGAHSALSVAIYMHDLRSGGVERQTLIIAEEFRRNGIEVTLVVHRLRGELVDQVPAGLRIVDLQSSRTLMDILHLAHFLRAERPDILLSNVDLNNVAALLAKAVSFSATRLLICQHNPISTSFVLEGKFLYRFLGLSYRILSPWISRAVAVSEGVAVEMQKIAGLRKDRVLTINNPVVGPDFHSRAEEPAEHPWLGQRRSPVFVTAGRLVTHKDHETLIRALDIHRRRFDSRLVILGVGPLEADLKALVTQLGLESSVDFLGFRRNILPYLRQADAFVLSSRCEGFGNVIVEALGCGTPVIATRCEYGPAEILDEGQYGVLVETRNPAAMAKAMDQVATLRDRFPSDILRRRAGEFSYAACASRYMAMFRSVIPHSARAT